MSSNNTTPFSPNSQSDNRKNSHSAIHKIAVPPTTRVVPLRWGLGLFQARYLAELEYTARRYVIVFAFSCKIDTFVVFSKIVSRSLAMFFLLIHDEQASTPCPWHKYPGIPRYRSPWRSLVSLDRPCKRILKMAQFTTIERTDTALVVTPWRMTNSSSIGTQLDPVLSRVLLSGLHA